MKYIYALLFLSCSVIASDGRPPVRATNPKLCSELIKTIINHPEHGLAKQKLALASAIDNTKQPESYDSIIIGARTTPYYRPMSQAIVEEKAVVSFVHTNTDLSEPLRVRIVTSINLLARCAARHSNSVLNLVEVTHAHKENSDTITNLLMKIFPDVPYCNVLIDSSLENAVKVALTAHTSKNIRARL